MFSPKTFTLCIKDQVCSLAMILDQAPIMEKQVFTVICSAFFQLWGCAAPLTESEGEEGEEYCMLRNSYFLPSVLSRFLYAKLLLLLTELRTLKVEGTRQIHHIHNREGLISMTPLLSEIIS